MTTRREFLQGSLAGLAGLALFGNPALAIPRRGLIGPYLQNVQGDTATVCWLGKGKIEFQGHISRLESMLHGTKVNHALLEGLEPGESYEYSVAGRRGRFTTPKDGPFSFAVIGDTQKNREDRNKERADRSRVFTEMKKHHSDFYLHLGDWVHDGRKFQQWLDFFEDFEPISADTPIVGALGNHERNDPDFFELLPGCPRYQSFERGICRFVILDSNYLMRKKDLAEQYALLEQMDDDKINIVACHHPVYSACNGRRGKTRRMNELGRMQRVLKDKLDKADLVLAGHDHNYQRIEKEGRIHIISGGGGGGLYGGFKYTKSLKEADICNHFLYAEVDKNLKITAINSEGQVIDQFEIDK